METETTSKYRGADMLRFFLMPFVCFASFGFPGPYGVLAARFSLFAPIAFYILCGFFLAAGESTEEGIYGRLLKKSALQFLLIFIVLIIINLILFSVTGTLSEAGDVIWTKRTLFNAIVLCTWPFRIGETIWFIQALFYARIILYFMDKFKLMRYYKIVMIVCILLMLMFGEFAGVIHFSFHGYTYIPGNAITRALPYMLLGRFVYEKRNTLFSRPSVLYVVTFLAGIGLALGEMALLGRAGYLDYTGHMIGFGIMAFSVCCLSLKRKKNEPNFFSVHGRSYSWRIYVLSQPVGNILAIFMGYVFADLYGLFVLFGGVIVYLVCLGLAFLIGYLRYLLKPRHPKLVMEEKE